MIRRNARVCHSENIRSNCNNYYPLLPHLEQERSSGCTRRCHPYSHSNSTAADRQWRGSPCVKEESQAKRRPNHVATDHSGNTIYEYGMFYDKQGNQAGINHSRRVYMSRTNGQGKNDKEGSEINYQSHTGRTWREVSSRGGFCGPQAPLGKECCLSEEEGEIPQTVISSKDGNHLSSGGGEDAGLRKSIPAPSCCSGSDGDVGDGGRKVDLLVELVTVFGETDAALMERAVTSAGEDLCLEIFEETKAIEANGGQWTDMGRRKTPGGVFLSALKKRLPRSKIQFIWEEQNKQRKTMKRLRQTGILK
eukprot:GHVQ01004136.1.p1 GENE.GHVQ01004136.1~~GHVQ01004136.1.p1  ORF type:complete len:307 (-),score=57.00 GHVQ01004136.1:307-1227(-)